MGDHHDEAAEVPAESRPPEPRGDEELRRTLDAQHAHGGSMAPDVVDPTGEPRAESPQPADPASAPDAANAGDAHDAANAPNARES